MNELQLADAYAIRLEDRFTLPERLIVKASRPWVHGKSTTALTMFTE